MMVKKHSFAKLPPDTWPAPTRCEKRKRGIVDTMVAFAAAVAIVALYGVLVSSSRVVETPTLVPWTFQPLPVGSIRPAGWILGEMQTMAQGLAGHEHDFYVYVNESRWLYPAGSGGIDYSDLNEALPYWFNGLVPLAYLLDDDRLKGQVHAVAETVLGLQTTDGWIGPEVPAERNFWARAPFFLGLTQLAEANATWEQPVIDGLRKFMTLTNTMLRNNSQGHANCAPGFQCQWGQTRVHDLIITIQWMLEKHPDPVQDQVLWDNMNMFYDQSEYKWDEWYQPSTYPQVVADPSTNNPEFPYLHGVNVGQGLKASAVIRRFKHNDSLVDASMTAVNWTFLYHGAPSGTILADEIERDLAPYMGSELCTAVETGYSLAYLYHTLGNNEFADRAELVIYNAMPVMMTGDMWAHQYMAQPNGPLATNNTEDFSPNGPYVFTTANSGAATTFGMEPQYPCCTVNHPQGYPKFVTHSWALAGATGLAHVLLGPSTVSTDFASIQCGTAYPFDNELTYTVTSQPGFDLYLRVPGWYNPATSSIYIGSGQRMAVLPEPTTGMHKITIPPNTSGLVVTYTIGTTVRTEPRANDTVSVYVGNMLYALDVGSKNTSSAPHKYTDATQSGLLTYLPFPDKLRDYYIVNTTAWNVAIDPSTLSYHPMNTNGAGGGEGLPTPVFEYGAPPTYISVQGCEIQWPMYLGSTPDVVPQNRTCIGEKQMYRLIPYGAAKVHMSELPIVQLS
ncbi:hypothetical protein QBC46DRAFT_441478 [Diplogelasinospora grovesii]|uniref:Uncharacterized protein n=1 Tax=Diplogelasinospora grovesii TaxID=303347 RepID=A0AAN6N4L9_9PEZI|nr:hypothetical protein QBC46DRAFT_441478 [Diplogelasinospora grovesii]